LDDYIDPSELDVVPALTGQYKTYHLEKYLHPTYNPDTRNIFAELKKPFFDLLKRVENRRKNNQKEYEYNDYSFF